MNLGFCMGLDICCDSCICRIRCVLVPADLKMRTAPYYRLRVAISWVTVIRQSSYCGWDVNSGISISAT